jgi:hypothetical protein
MSDWTRDWNNRLESMRCEVCGSEAPDVSDLMDIIRWVADHEHTAVEREAARIVKRAEKRRHRWT